MNPENNGMWECIYYFLLSCGKERDPYALCGTATRKLQRIIPYDQARILFLDMSGRIFDSLLYGVSKKNWKEFLDYYSHDMLSRQHLFKSPLQLSEKDKVSLCDWTSDDDRKSIFYQEYVRGLQLKYCLGIGLSDKDNCLRCIITLDRTGDTPYSEKDLLFVRHLRPLLEDLFANLLAPAPESYSRVQVLSRQYQLTERETEIVSLICNGLAPAAIAGRLCLSVSTVYRHIANVYGKLGISNRQELFSIFQAAK